MTYYINAIHPILGEWRGHVVVSDETQLKQRVNRLGWKLKGSVPFMYTEV